MKKKTKASIAPSRYQVNAPPEADPVYLCATHYEAWRDGPRTGPAVVVDRLYDLEDRDCEPCIEEAAERLKEAGEQARREALDKASARAATPKSPAVRKREPVKAPLR